MTEQPPPDPLPLVQEFFPALAPDVLARLGRLCACVREWNERVNLVSRKDVGHLEEHHLLHSLAIARMWRPAAGALVADLGTGGGFPGMPLAVLYPECRFTLVDSIAKKARVVEEVAATLGLRNVRVLAARAETLRGPYDYVLGRAVTALPQFLGWAAPLLRPGREGEPANGVLYFKGTLYREELAGSRCAAPAAWPLIEMYPGRGYFEEKFLLHFAAPVRA